MIEGVPYHVWALWVLVFATFGWATHVVLRCWREDASSQDD